MSCLVLANFAYCVPDYPILVCESFLVSDLDWKNNNQIKIKQIQTKKYEK